MRLTRLAAAVSVLSLFAASPAVYAADSHDHQHHESKAKEDHGHEHEEHHHEAPHGGTLIVLGDEHAAHLEVVFDSAKGRLTGYVLDGEAEKAIRISQADIKLAVSGGDLASSQTVTLKPVASPLTGEKAGDTSQFEATVPELKGKKKFDLVISAITVRGQEYRDTKASFPDGNH